MRRRPTRSAVPGEYARWVVACAVAETIGMTASAAAARIGQDLADDTRGRWLALGVVVAGGLVEGTALGVLQGRVLWSSRRSLNRTAFALVTVLVAGIGWAAASAPGVLAGDDGGGSGPSTVLMLLGGLGLGLVMGPVLGAAQAFTFRRVVAHPWRWITAYAAAWPLAMALIFAGASTAGASWPTWAVAGYGSLTGLLAGSALGLVSGWWLGSLDGQPLKNRAALAMVAGEHLGMQRRLVGLAVTGRRTGRVVRFPVQYAVHGTDLVVVPGHPERKRWWRNLTDVDASVWVLDGSGWHFGSAHVLFPSDPEHPAAIAAYQQRWRHFNGAESQPVVVLHLVGPGIPTVSAGF